MFLDKQVLAIPDASTVQSEDMYIHGGNSVPFLLSSEASQWPQKHRRKEALVNKWNFVGQTVLPSVYNASPLICVIYFNDKCIF